MRLLLGVGVATFLSGAGAAGVPRAAGSLTTSKADVDSFTGMGNGADGGGGVAVWFAGGTGAAGGGVGTLGV